MADLYQPLLPRWLNYCHAMVTTLDLDPVYSGMRGAFLSQEITRDQFDNFMVSFALLYSLEESCKIVEMNLPTNELWKYLIDNYETLKRGRARRFFREKKGMNCLNYLVEHFETSTQFIEEMYDPCYEKMAEKFAKVPSFGPYFTWKWLDLYDRVYGMECKITLDYAVQNLPGAPIKGAKLVSSELWPEDEFDLKRVLQHMIQECQRVGLMAPPSLDRLVDIQEIETCLCGIVHMYKGTHVDKIGKDLRSKYEEVYKVGKTAGWLLKHMPRPLPHDIEFNDPYLKVQDSSSSFNLLDL